MRKVFFLFSFSGLAVAVDQLAKLYIYRGFKLGESRPVIENFFHLTFVKNYGAAFGIFGESHPQFREWFFLLMPPFAMVIILLLLKSAQEKDRMQVFALSSIMGGALGNYIDRWLHGYVVDFLDFHYLTWTWPTFNFADVFIVCGVFLLIISMFLEERKLKTT
jgi:signal peptidase II